MTGKIGGGRQALRSARIEALFVTSHDEARKLQPAVIECKAVDNSYLGTPVKAATRRTS